MGSDTTSPYGVTWNNVAAGTYLITAVARDNNGAPTTSARVTATLARGGPPAGLLARWLSRDVGGAAVAGSAAYSSGVFTVKGAGVDIWNTSDQFRLVYQPLTGDGEIVAQVLSLQNTDSWAKAGVMIRETLTATSRHAFMAVTAGNGVSFQRRTTTGGSTVSTTDV